MEGLAERKFDVVGEKKKLNSNDFFVLNMNMHQ